MKEAEYPKLNSMRDGKRIKRPVYITSIVDKETKNGKKYVTVEVRDSTGRESVNMFQWKANSNVSKTMLEGDGIHEDMLITARLLKNGVFMNVEGFELDVDPDVTLNDFAQKIADDPEELFSRITQTLQSVSAEYKSQTNTDQPTLSDLALKLYSKYHDQLVWSAAAELMHSEKSGGLMEHTEAMVYMAECVCDVYEDLDRDLLVAATALHDIGKIQELKTNAMGVAKYEPKGICIGHIVLGHEMIKQFVDKAPEKYPEERLLLLEHLILAHHGHKEYGSPVEPVVPEAFMLHAIDCMDATHNEMRKAYEGMSAGAISDGRPLGIDHRIYKPL